MKQSELIYLYNLMVNNKNNVNVIFLYRELILSLWNTSRKNHTVLNWFYSPKSTSVMSIRVASTSMVFVGLPSNAVKINFAAIFAFVAGIMTIQVLQFNTNERECTLIWPHSGNDCGLVVSAPAWDGTGWRVPFLAVSDIYLFIYFSFIGSKQKLQLNINQTNGKNRMEI